MGSALISTDYLVSTLHSVMCDKRYSQAGNLVLTNFSGLCSNLIGQPRFSLYQMVF